MQDWTIAVPVVCQEADDPTRHSVHSLSHAFCSFLKDAIVVVAFQHLRPVTLEEAVTINAVDDLTKHYEHTSGVGEAVSWCLVQPMWFLSTLHAHFVEGGDYHDWHSP